SLIQPLLLVYSHLRLLPTYHSFVEFLYIPPFPTRRSSDLGPSAHRRLPARAAATAGHHPRARRRGLDDRIPLPAPGRGRRRGARDRKSTRLNSSHVSISYAVFCLKKKNIKTW